MKLKLVLVFAIFISSFSYAQEKLNQNSITDFQLNGEVESVVDKINMVKSINDILSDEDMAIGEPQDGATFEWRFSKLGTLLYSRNYIETKEYDVEQIGKKERVIEYRVYNSFNNALMYSYVLDYKPNRIIWHSQMEGIPTVNQYFNNDSNVVFEGLMNIEDMKGYFYQYDKNGDLKLKGRTDDEEWRYYYTTIYEGDVLFSITEQDENKKTLNVVIYDEEGRFKTWDYLTYQIHYEYSDFDEYGNWTKCEKYVSNKGKKVLNERINREIKYY